MVYHRTAIHRKSLPTPTRWLLKEGLVAGLTLDYGCGHCHEINNRYFLADGFDPHYQPHGVQHISYDTVLCNFVLNVIPSKETRAFICREIQKLLKPNGLAYISVRNDQKKLRGYTSRGTWQGYVIPPGKLIHTTSSYRMYSLTKTFGVLNWP